MTMWPFRKKRDTSSEIARAFAKIWAQEAADPLNDDGLYYAWRDGPGKNYPTHEVMMSEIEGAPLKPYQIMNDGWDKAFYAWAAEQKK